MQLANVLLGIYGREMKTFIQKPVMMFMETLCVIAPN